MGKRFEKQLGWEGSFPFRDLKKATKTRNLQSPVLHLSRLFHPPRTDHQQRVRKIKFLIKFLSHERKVLFPPLPLQPVPPHHPPSRPRPLLFAHQPPHSLLQKKSSKQ